MTVYVTGLTCAPLTGTVLLLRPEIEQLPLALCGRLGASAAVAGEGIAYVQECEI